MITAIHAFAEQAPPARRLASALGAPFEAINLHVFPDGESLPTVGAASGVAGLYCSLYRPDGKIMPLLLAADALRRRGAERLVLIAPYLCYMRQDALFHPGEPLSRDVSGAVLGRAFDWVVTVEPHLHRTVDLAPSFAGARVIALSAASALADAIQPADPDLIVIGPDTESAPWAGAVADVFGAPSLTFQKTRRGDQDVTLTLAEPGRVAGRPVLLVDDICASGGTLEAAIERLAGAGAGPIDVAVVHALFDEAAGRRLVQRGARRILSTDSCPHPTNAAPLAPLIADALRTLPL